MSDTPKTIMPEGRTRKGGRAALRRERAKRDHTMLPALKRQLPLVEPMRQEQIEKIDAASMAILEEVGVVFRDDQAIADWRSVGAVVRDGDRVHLDRALVRELIRSIPSSFTYHARNPEISLMNFMIGQMARHYDVPWRTSNTLGGSKTFDAQAGYESATMMAAGTSPSGPCPRHVRCSALMRSQNSMRPWTRHCASTLIAVSARYPPWMH